MRTEQATRRLLPALVMTMLMATPVVFAACTGLADTRAATISTPALIFESPTPSTAAEESEAETTPDLVVVVVTPTSADNAGEGNQDTADNTDAASSEGASAAQAPEASGTVTATTTAVPQNGAAATPASVEMSEDELLSTGEQVFSTNCASCHQLNGEGTSAYPALNNNDFVTGEDPTAVITTILHGRGEMPAFADNLSTQQIAAVASYIGNAWDNSAAVVMVAQARQVKQGGSASLPSAAAAAETTAENATPAAEGTPAATGTMTATATVTATTSAPAQATATVTATIPSTTPASATTAPGVTWTPAPVVTATVETTPIPTGTPMPEASPTAEEATTPVPEATAAGTTPDAEATMTPQPAVTATPMSDDQLISMGQDVYARNCASCHQLNGEGTSSYPALNNNAFVTNEEPTGPIEVALHGRGEMPAFEDTLSNQEIAAVLSYVRSTWDNSATVVHTAQVRQVAQGGGAAAGEANTDSTSPADAQGTATVTATTPMTATSTVTTTAEGGQGATAETTPAATTTASDAETPAATATLTSTVAAGEAAQAGEPGTDTEETAEAGVPKQAEATIEPPELDSMTAMDEAAEEATPVNPEALISLGENLYTMNCAACHQAEGQGIDGVYPMLAGNAFVTTEDPAPAVEVVITGRAGMPRFSDDLSARQIAAILSYVRTAWDNDASTVNPEQVRSIRETVSGSGEAGGH